MNYPKKIEQIKSGIERRNKRYSKNDGDGIHILLFRMMMILIFTLFLVLLACIIGIHLGAEFLDDLPLDILITLMITSIFITIGTVILRGLRLKKQRDTYGKYIDYNIDLPNSDHLDTTSLGALLHSMINKIAGTNLIDFAAHNLATIFASTKNTYKPALELNFKEMRAGSLILHCTDDHKAITTTELEKYDDYKVLSKEEVSNLFKTLHELDYIRIHKTESSTTIIQIDNPETDLLY